MDWYEFSDGTATWFGADGDGDGYVDLVSFDGYGLGHVNGEGLVDAWFIDGDHDGTADVFVVDTDGDGVMDAYAVDADSDGYWDPLAPLSDLTATADPTGLDPWTLGGGLSLVDQQNMWGNILNSQAAMNDAMIWN